MATDMLNASAVAVIANLARETGLEVRVIEAPEDAIGVPKKVPAIFDPKDGSVIGTKDLFDSWRTSPEAKLGTARVTTLVSFIELVNRHKTEHSVIFANMDWQKPSLTAVIDYHQKENGGAADNGKHRIQYEFPLSEEWKAWTAMNGKGISQTDFAEFIEDHIADLAGPDEAEELEFQNKFSFKVAFPNQLVTLSRGLLVTAETRVKNVVSLQNGAGQIVFEEDHQTHDKEGNRIDVPGMFILSVPPFFEGETARIPVRLRYRKTPSGLVWSFHLYRPDHYVTKQVRDDLTRAAADTALPSFQGIPEMQA